MPHPNALKQLENYGPIVEELDKITDLIDERFGKNIEAYEATKELVELSRKYDLRPIIEELSDDNYAYNRELAAVTIWYLWLVLDNDIKYNPKQAYSVFVDRIREKAIEMAWIWPILRKLFLDKRSGPAELALRTVEVNFTCYISDEIQKQLRDDLIKLFSNSTSSEVRLQIIQSLPNLYPMNDNAESIFDEPSLECLIKATGDSDTEVRNWACFVIRLHVDNLNSKIEKALEYVLKTEPYDSETYREALIGLARFGRKDIEKIICKQLATGNCKISWFYAVEASQSTDCLLAMLRLYENTLEEADQETIIPAWYEAIEDVLIGWNT